MKKRILIGLLAVLAVVPLVWGSSYILHIATMAAIMIPLAVAMNIMLRIGQMSMAQAAFMGIGAYTGALLTMRLGLPAPLSLLAGGLLCAAIACALGPVFMRIKGIYFVLLTFAFGQMVHLLLQDWVALTGGNSGLYGIPKFSIFGFRLTKTWQYYLLALSVACTVVLAIRRLEKSDVGAILDSLNVNEMVSRSLGAKAMSWRIATFVVSAFISGISGGIYAFYIGFLSPDPFGFRMMVDLIVMNVIGGVATIIGPVLGALLVVPLPELMREFQEYQMLGYAITLMVFVLYFRDGIVAWFGLHKKDGK